MAGGHSSESSSARSASSSGSSQSSTASQTSSGTSSSSDDSRSGSNRGGRHKLSEIRKADQIFGRNSSITGTMGYGRLSSAGKSTVDHTIRKLVNIIGRAGFDADCQIRSDARLVSRRHACLFWDEEADQWAIECLSSKNGMLVDGTPLVVGAPPLHLRSKNLIEMGDAAFFFLEAAAPTFRTSDVIRTEALVLDLRASRKKKRLAPSGSTSSFHQSRKRSRMASIRAPSTKRSVLKGKKKHRSHAADVETDDSSNDEEVQIAEREKEEEPVGRRRASKTTPSVQSKQSRKSNAGKFSRTMVAEEDDVSPAKSADYPAPRTSSGKRKLSLKKAGGPSTPASKKRKTSIVESPSRSAEVGGASGTPQKYREEWNKKEKTDFGRALFAIGVDPIRDEQGNVTYDWTRFRGIAELAKKSDAMLADYYQRIMHDVETLLEEEEREKRTKGPRTKHKPKCDCVVCENTRKSRRKKREENSTVGNVPDPSAAAGSADEDDEAAVKSTGRTEDRLVGLVTAQKLRVRMSIHEAARQVDSEAGVAVINKLSSQSHTTGANGDLPSWWITGKHDRALMIGTAKHGVGQWQEIWKDEELEEFAAVHEEEGEDAKWPTPQTAMKRLREVASSINAEIRRLTKREARRAAVQAEKGEDVKSMAKEEKPKGKGKGKGKSKAKGNAAQKSTEKVVDKGKTKGKAKGKSSVKNIPQVTGPKQRSTYAYGDAGGVQTQSEGSESRGSTQEESEVEAGYQGTRGEEQSRQEVDEDDDEVEVEVEEEEEFEVEVVEESADDAEQQQAQQVVDTDDEDGDDDDGDDEKIEFETASESGSD